MGKHILLFQQQSEYNAYYASGERASLHVAYSKKERKVNYHAFTDGDWGGSATVPPVENGGDD